MDEMRARELQRTERMERRLRREKARRRNIYRSYLIIAVLITVIMGVIMSLAMNIQEKQYESEIQQVEAANKAKLTIYSGMGAIQENETLTTDQAFQLSQKYWYVLRDMTESSGFGITEIKYLDDICKEKNLNPHIMWCIYDIESGYNAGLDNYTGSSGRGLGQLLSDTAQYLYEDVLCLGTYTHDMAYDPRTNMLLTVSLVDFYIEEGLEYTIQKYSGDSSGVYWNKFQETAKDHNVDVTTVTYL